MARFRGPLLLLLAAVAGCAPIPLEVEYAGCKAVWMPGPVCGLDEDRKLQLWVGAPPDARIEIQVNGRKIDATAEPIRDGQGFSLTLPSGAKRVDVLVAVRWRETSWSLSLAEPGEPPVVQAGAETPCDVMRAVDEKTRRAYGLIRQRDLNAVRSLLSDIRLPPGSPAESRYLLSFYKGLLAEREGYYRSALTEIHRAVEIAERVKEARYRWLAEEELALTQQGVGRFREAARLFEELRRAPYPWNSCEEAQLLNNQGWSELLAREAGESLGDPTSLLEEALATYGTCEAATIEQRANVLLNLTLAHLQEGRLSRAKDLLAQARRLEPHASIPHTLWQLDLEARIELLEGRPAEALRRLDDLEAIASTTSSFDGLLRAAIWQARSHMALGHPAAALEILGRAEGLLDYQSLQIPVQEGRETFAATRQAIVSLHLEILLDEGRNVEALEVARRTRSRLLRQLERSDRLATLTPERRKLWERRLTDYQERRAALEERARAEWKLPADQLPRDRAAREAEAEEVKRILDEAFLVVAEPGEWTRQVPPPRAEELTLAYHPLSREWVGFAAEGATVLAHRFELPPGLGSEELAERLLLPFRTAIERAGRIRILATGLLRGVDFHALPFGGDVLLASAPVVYGLDLPVSTAPARMQGRRALLVADPRDDLPGTLDEARRVLQVLRSRSRPWSVEVLKGGEASSEAVRERLVEADLLHYAGHGSFSGFGGWDSSLLLAEETQLTLGDLLALERVPTWAVLSACDTGRSSTDVPVESLGLAQAFLLAGSRAVVASIRPASDRDVPAFFPELYREWEREPDLAAALQRAQLSWRQRNPGADWEGFRLFEP